MPPFLNFPFLYYCQFLFSHIASIFSHNFIFIFNKYKFLGPLYSSLSFPQQLYNMKNKKLTSIWHMFIALYNFIMCVELYYHHHIQDIISSPQRSSLCYSVIVTPLPYFPPFLIPRQQITCFPSLQFIYI